MKTMNYACFKLKERDTSSVKKKKNNFINGVEDNNCHEY